MCPPERWRRRRRHAAWRPCIAASAFHRRILRSCTCAWPTARGRTAGKRIDGKEVRQARAKVQKEARQARAAMKDMQTQQLPARSTESSNPPNRPSVHTHCILPRDTCTCLGAHVAARPGLALHPRLPYRAHMYMPLMRACEHRGEHGRERKRALHTAALKTAHGIRARFPSRAHVCKSVQAGGGSLCARHAHTTRAPDRVPYT